jgi:tetratricopeptide (TPR) repeat protein
VASSLKILAILVIGVQAIFADVGSILEHVYRTEYGMAFEKIKEDSSSCVLKGIIFASRYDDLGDTLDAHSALSVLEKCKTSEFWEPYRIYEIALIKKEFLKQEIRGGWNLRKAAMIFEKRSDIDSKAFYAIYGYYTSIFGKSNYVEDIKKGFAQSKLFSPVFGNSLIWILYEEKRYAEALSVVNTLLEHYPGHPVFLQTKADVLYKFKKVEEAVAIYKESEAFYAKRGPSSIRYWCAVANLAKMTSELFWKEKLQSEEYKQIKRWMPKGI